MTEDFLHESAQCVDIIRSSWRAIDRIGILPGGKERLTKSFQLCHPLKTVTELKSWLFDIYANIAMVDYPYPTSFLADLPAFPIRALCANVTSSMFEAIDTDEETIKRIVRGVNVFFNYTGQTPCFDTGSEGTPSVSALGWSYQSCTEFVMPICSNGITDMFDIQPWDFQAWSEYCFVQWKVRPRLEWPFMEYGGKTFADFRYDSNIVFTNGNLDPWSSGGVNTTITPRLPAILIEGGAHHLDLRAANPADPQSVINAREQIIQLIQNWISGNSR